MGEVFNLIREKCAIDGLVSLLFIKLATKVVLNVKWLVYVCTSYVGMSSTTAGLRRSFLLRKDRQSSPGEPQTPDANHTEFLIYEEVTQYRPRPGERPRLIVLIGTLTVGFDDIEEALCL